MKSKINKKQSQSRVQKTKDNQNVELMYQNSSISIPEMTRIMGVTERSIERNIQKLQKNNNLERVGGAKDGYWSKK